MLAIGQCKPGTLCRDEPAPPHTAGALLQQLPSPAGMFYRDVGGIITKHVNSCGFQVDKTYCGHGIGQYFHCAPNIPHYAGNKAKYVMKPGHCFTIEPMINMGSWKVSHSPQ